MEIRTSNRALRTAALLTLTLLLGACGGGDGSAASAPTPVEPTPDPAASSDESNVEQVKAPAAWRSGYTGSGVTVAVLDSGARVTHEAIADAIINAYNAVDGSADVTDTSGHGTHVAGIVGGSEASGVGVAPDAMLLPVKIVNSYDVAERTSVAAAIDYATGAGVKILNLSQWIIVDPVNTCGAEVYGCDDGVTDALYQYTANGGLVVVAAGNHGTSNPRGLGFYADHPDYHGNVLVVGAVSGTTMEWYSNRAGAQQAAYLVAPGTTRSAASTADDEYSSDIGTSMATPHVSAAAAIVWSRWPHLSAHQVMDVLLASATDLGEPGVDAVYGHGLLNMEAAMQQAVSVP